MPRIRFRFSIASSLQLSLAAVLALSLPSHAVASWPPDGALITTIGGTLATQIRMLNDGAQGHFVGWTLGYQGGQMIDVTRLSPDGSTAPGWPSNGAYGFVRPFPNTRCWELLGDGGTGVLLIYRDQSTLIRIMHVLASGALDPAWPSGGVTQSASYIDQLTAASDDSGGCYIAWSQVNALRVTRVICSGHLAGGWPADGRFIPAPSGSGVFLPRVVPDGAGGVVLAWLSEYDVWANRLTRNGKVASGWPSWGLEFGEPPPEIGTNPSLELIPAGAGHAIMAWVDRSSGTRLMLMRFAFLDGTPDWDLEAFSTAADSVRDVTLVPDGADGAFVLWDASQDARITRALSSGTIAPGWPVGGVDPVPSGTPYQHVFSASATPAGGLVFAWRDGVFDRARWLLSDGNPDPSQPIDGRQVHPSAHNGWTLSLIADDAGGAFAVWAQPDTVNFNFYPGPVYMSWLTYPTPLSVPRGHSSSALALYNPAPNPTAGAVELRLALTGDAPARLELLDLAGRRVRAREIAGAGEHVVRFDGLGALRPGLYLVRLRQGDATRVARVAIVH